MAIRALYSNLFRQPLDSQFAVKLLKLRGMVLVGLPVSASIMDARDASPNKGIYGLRHKWANVWGNRRASSLRYLEPARGSSS